MALTNLLSGSFESLVARPVTHVVVEFDPSSRTLLVLFGGIAGGVSMPVYEFFRQAAALTTSKAFLRDPRRGWYQLGIPGVGESAAAIASHLQAIIARATVDRVVMAGASAGGFAAILFGTVCAADAVIAFSPQTFIDGANRARTGDRRWQPQIDDVHRALGDRPATLDLVDVLPAQPGKTSYQIHVSADDELDMLHAHRIVDRGRVDIVEHERGGHRLVKTLRDRGLLQPLLRQALGAEVHDEAAGSTVV
ncbi:MAG: hypothetical protein H0T18_06300 [Chloroflexia bacterium]|nr:hypothetical protein [Chloroflexia bacterium]